MRVPKVSYRPIALVWRVEVQPEEFWVALESVLEGWIDADFSVLTRFGADLLCSGFAKPLVCDASGGHLFVTFVTFHQNASNNESRSIFKHQHLSTKLNRLTGLATFINLSVWFKHTEKLVAAEDAFSVDHTSRCRISHPFGANDKCLQCVGAEQIGDLRQRLSDDAAEVSGPLRQSGCFLQ